MQSSWFGVSASLYPDIPYYTFERYICPSSGEYFLRKYCFLGFLEGQVRVVKEVASTCP